VMSSRSNDRANAFVPSIVAPAWDRPQPFRAAQPTTAQRSSAGPGDYPLTPLSRIHAPQPRPQGIDCDLRRRARLDVTFGLFLQVAEIRPVGQAIMVNPHALMPRVRNTGCIKVCSLTRSGKWVRRCPRTRVRLAPRASIVRRSGDLEQQYWLGFRPAVRGRGRWR
jgi:hypothetical protein